MDDRIRYTCSTCSKENCVETIFNMRKDGRTGWTLCDHCKSYVIC